ncbi:septum site-determining protein MinC [Butyrivibrio sp. WCD3002]|uniref:septum site-determining protein MinC n=1 Tax=Butyrivibrio sp. WCD3002 TaxID=1280676 RepID=UPI000415525E|nr:septum site-determining protein MinC [Butyrivibrio sp. WCD3002]
MGSVSIKGTGSGIILELDRDISFENLTKDIASKFRESSSFFGRVSVGLLIKGRILSDDEEAQILDIIAQNSKLTITCVICEDPDTNELFNRFSADNAASNITYSSEDNSFLQTEMTEAYDGIKDTVPESVLQDIVPDRDDARIIYGSMRSGMTLNEKKSLIILGDVKPGATVESDGSIFILGALRGSVYAGAGGDESAYVFALEMDPLQIRIANAIAISPDADKGPKLKTRKFRKKVTEKVPEVAYILNGHVVKDSYGPSFKRDNKLI